MHTNALTHLHGDLEMSHERRGFFFALSDNPDHNSTGLSGNEHP